MRYSALLWRMPSKRRATPTRDRWHAHIDLRGRSLADVL